MPYYCDCNNLKDRVAAMDKVAVDKKEKCKKCGRYAIYKSEEPVAKVEEDEITYTSEYYNQDTTSNLFDDYSDYESD
jgi:hypothetical protein